MLNALAWTMEHLKCRSDNDQAWVCGKTATPLFKFAGSREKESVMGQVVGTSVPRIDTLEKVLGSGKFVADLHLLDCSTADCASVSMRMRVLAVDTSEAERLPGVQAVLTAWNTPEYRFGRTSRTRRCLHATRSCTVGLYWLWRRRIWQPPKGGSVYPGHLRTIASGAGCWKRSTRCASPHEDLGDLSRREPGACAWQRLRPNSCGLG